MLFERGLVITLGADFPLISNKFGKLHWQGNNSDNPLLDYILMQGVVQGYRPRPGTVVQSASRVPIG